MIEWGRADCDRIAPTALAVSLLNEAVSLRPDDARLHEKLAYAHLERTDFGSARASLEQVLRLAPAAHSVRRLLARCHNAQHRPEAALDVLRPVEEPQLERGIALLATGSVEDAEREFRALLDRNPNDRHACRHIGKLLRRAGRIQHLLQLCEQLWSRGATNSQLLYSWGTALSLTGDDEKAASLLMDPARITSLTLPVPLGFDDLDAFNCALAGDILANADRRTDFPVEDEANRGSQRVHSLLAGKRPDLVKTLLSSIQSLVDAFEPRRAAAFDPWLDARPERARINAWGLIQRDSQYEEWHLHRAGWLSGVYYVRVPQAVSHGNEAGCIEFGNPRSLVRERPELDQRERIVPREGLLLLSPSHYSHRTIPMGLDDYRISFAFDVTPVAGTGAEQ